MISLVLGSSKSGRNTLPRFFNQDMAWNYAIYSKGKSLKVRPVHQIQINNTVIKDINEQSEYDKILRLEDIKNSHSLKYSFEYYISNKRKIDPGHFIRKCYQNVINGNEMKDLMITDFRFPEEYDFLKKKGKMLRTIRIVKDINWFSKDTLEDFQTDFLLLPLNDHELKIKDVIEKHPQYEKYNFTPYFHV